MNSLNSSKPTPPSRTQIVIFLLVSLLCIVGIIFIIFIQTSVIFHVLFDVILVSLAIILFAAGYIDIQRASQRGQHIPWHRQLYVRLGLILLLIVVVSLLNTLIGAFKAS